MKLYHNEIAVIATVLCGKM